MQERVLNTWKEIATYLSRGVRTVQRWELTYGLPVHRPSDDAQTVYAFADEIDAWMQRTKHPGSPYVRPTFIVVDAITPGALSDLKLAIEAAKFNVLTAFTRDELFATAARYNVDGFIIDSVLLDTHPAEIGRELRRLYPAKPRLLLGDEDIEEFNVKFTPGDAGAVVGWLIATVGQPKIVAETSVGSA